MAQCSGESTRLPPMWRVRILASTAYVGRVCCGFSPLLRQVFLRVLRFSLSLKTNTSKFQFDLVRTDTFQRFCRTLKCSVGKRIKKKIQRKGNFYQKEAKYVGNFQTLIFRNRSKSMEPNSF